MRKIPVKLTKSMPRWDGIETVQLNKNQRGDELFPYVMGSLVIPYCMIESFSPSMLRIFKRESYTMLGPEPLHSKDEAISLPLLGLRSWKFCSSFKRICWETIFNPCWVTRDRQQPKTPRQLRDQMDNLWWSQFLGG